MHRILNFAFFLLGDSPAYEFYVLTFRNIEFSWQGITQMKEYNIRNTAKV